MSDKLYVFETICQNGFRVTGTSGLPYHDMVRLQTFYNGIVSDIVPAPTGTSRLNIKTPIVKCTNVLV